MKHKGKQNFQSRRLQGLNLIELLVFVALVACTFIGAKIAHSFFAGTFWWLLGGLLGFLAAMLGFAAFVAILDFWSGGVPRLPRCRNGCCRREDYKLQQFKGEFVRVCRCGGRYKRQGKRFVIIDEDGTTTLYLIWRPFRGWFPDKMAKRSGDSG